MAELDCAVWKEVLNDKQLATVLAAVEEMTKVGASQYDQPFLEMAKNCVAAKKTKKLRK